MTKKEPLYSGLKQDLLRKINRRIWNVGDQLPTEEKLMKDYSLSRYTVRRALQELEEEGYISRTPRRGAILQRVSPRIERARGEIVSFTQQLAQAGLEPQARILFRGLVKASTAGGRVMVAFGVPPQEEVVHIKRLKLGGQRPFSIQSVYLLPHLCPDILEYADEDLAHLFRLYEKLYHRVITRANEILQLGAAYGEEAALLQIEPGAPVVIRDRISFCGDEAFEVLYSLDRGDAYEYQYVIVNDQTGIAGGSRTSATGINRTP